LWYASHKTNTPKNNEIFYPQKIAKTFALIGFSALSAIAVAPAHAVVLDFNELPNTFTSIGNSYTNQGFTIASGLGTRGNLSTTSLFIESVGATASLTKVGGGAFDLSSIDLAGNNNDPTPVPVTFTGQKADNSTVSQIFTTSGTLTLNTFNFTNFTNLVSVNWAQDVFPYHQFDNINVSAASATAVPEPFTVLGTIFGAGYGVALKRKLAKAKLDKEDIS
jgi:hypothetical protein